MPRLVRGIRGALSCGVGGTESNGTLSHAIIPRPGCGFCKTKHDFTNEIKESLPIVCGSRSEDKSPANLDRLRPVAAQVGDEAARAFRRARLADVAPVQDQPVMGVLEVDRKSTRLNSSH